MAQCRFCRRRFRSDQAVKAHLRFCPRYKPRDEKQPSALGTKPKAESIPAATAPFQSDAQVAQPDLTAPWREFINPVNEFSRTLAEPPSPQQQRRKLLQAVKEQVIVHYRTPLGQVTAAMRGVAKAAIERELNTLPLEELPFEEVFELAVAIRDRVYDPVFEKQAQEIRRLDAEGQERSRKERQELGAWRRAHRRKEALIDQARGQANAMCEAKQVVGRNRLSVLCDIESRLNEFLTGDESITEAQATVQRVLDARFVEVDAMVAAANAKRDAKWREDMLGLLVVGGLMALPILASKYPDQVLPIISWIERTFGKKPTPEGAPTAKASPETEAPSAPSSAPPPRRRWRKHPAPPSGSEPERLNPIDTKPSVAQKAMGGYTETRDLGPFDEVQISFP